MKEVLTIGDKTIGSGLVIRTAAVRRPDLGYIVACDITMEREDIPHAYIFKWKPDALQQGDRNYNAHSICLVEAPEPALVDVSGQGYYSFNGRSGMVSGDILDSSLPPPEKLRTGGFRAVSEVAGKAYAVGLRGMVYRLDAPTTWARIDEGLPDDFNGQAIHGFTGEEVYAVGRNGNLWQFDGRHWVKRQLPTNGNLTAVRCFGNKTVYVGGLGGVLIVGRNDTWEVIDHGATQDDLWDIDFFGGNVYVSTMRGVYRLEGAELELVDFGKDPPGSCYQLSVGKGVMWSNGEFDIMSFDGRVWTRVV